MNTYTHTRSFAAAVGLLALALALPRAEARTTTHGAYYVAYTDAFGRVMHTEPAKTPAKAMEQFRLAALTDATIYAN